MSSYHWHSYKELGPAVSAWNPRTGEREAVPLGPAGQPASLAESASLVEDLVSKNKVGRDRRHISVHTQINTQKSSVYLG